MVPGSTPACGGLWFFIISVLPANLVKSTSTSARSAGASTICFTGTGTSNMPPSAPICQRLGPPMSRLRIRALQPFRIRNRYIRGSTSRNGQTLPLTSIVSPKYSPIQVTPAMSLRG